MNIKIYKYGVKVTCCYSAKEIEKEWTTVKWNYLQVQFMRFKWGIQKSNWNLGFLNIKFGKEKAWL